MAHPLTRLGYMREPTVSIEWIDAKEAAAIVRDWNEGNRRMTETSLARLRRTIDARGWMLMPDAIAFDTSMKLLNGQHRLALVAEGKEARQFVVLRGLNRNAWDGMDKGKSRSFSDTLRNRGEVDTNQLSATLNILLQYEQTKAIRRAGGDRNATEPELLALLARNPDIRDCIQPGKRFGRRTAWLPTSAAAALYYCMWKGTTRADADAFFERVITGDRLVAGDAILALRARMQEHNAAVGRRSFDKRIDLTVRIALTVVAFNKWMAGTPVQHLRWRAGGAGASEFPLVQGYAPLYNVPSKR